MTDDRKTNQCESTMYTESRKSGFPDDLFRRTVFAGTPARKDPMPMQPIDTPELLDAALAVSLQTRREKLARAVRNQRILMRVAFGLSGCIAIFALAAYLIGDYAAARGCATAACVTFALTYFAGMAVRKNAAESLWKFDQP